MKGEKVTVHMIPKKNKLKKADHRHYHLNLSIDDMFSNYIKVEIFLRSCDSCDVRLFSLGLFRAHNAIFVANCSAAEKIP